VSLGTYGLPLRPLLRYVRRVIPVLTYISASAGLIASESGALARFVSGELHQPNPLEQLIPWFSLKAPRHLRRPPVAFFEVRPATRCSPGTLPALWFSRSTARIYFFYFSCHSNHAVVLGCHPPVFPYTPIDLVCTILSDRWVSHDWSLDQNHNRCRGLYARRVPLWRVSSHST
jgi:hypothetical protein